MELLTQLFNTEHLEMQRKSIHAKYDEQYKKQGEDHRAWLATFYTRAKRFPSPLMPCHTFDKWVELRKNEDPSNEVILWLEKELQYWINKSDEFKHRINSYAGILDEQHETMIRVSLIAEKNRLREMQS